MKMPRGAKPALRNELAASEPYQPDAGTEIFVPSGEFPTPNHEIASAHPFRAGAGAPESFIAWPVEIGSWGRETSISSTWAEEAFAKACAEPKVLIPTNAVEAAARECGSSNFSAFMQTHGFQMEGKTYLDGQFNSIDWTNSLALNGAIASLGAVKIGIGTANFSSGATGRVTPDASGWAIYGLPAGQPETQFASLCGYGPLLGLIELFGRHGVTISLPPRMPTGLCYAMFVSNSIGIIDRESLMNIIGEAWARIPTTITKNLGE